MKIEINQLNDSFLDKLPIKESRAMYLTKKYGNMYDLAKFDRHWGRSESSKDPYKILYRVLDSYIGKQFDKAFSYFCTLIDFQFQYIFLKEFEDSRIYIHKDYYSFLDYYYIDKVGNIQVHKSDRPKRYKNKRTKKEYYESIKACKKRLRLEKLLK